MKRKNRQEKDNRMIESKASTAFQALFLGKKFGGVWGGEINQTFGKK